MVRRAPTPTAGATPAADGPPTARPRLLEAYVAVVCAAGLVVAAGFATGGLGRRVASAPAEFALLLGLLALGDWTPVRIKRRNEETQITASTMFGFAVLLGFGPGPAALAMGAASVVVDLLHRRSPMKVAFNAAQYVLAMGLGGTLYARLAPVPFPSEGAVTPVDFVPLLVASAVFSVTGIALVAVAIRLARGHEGLALHLATAPFQAFTDLVSVALAPLVVVVADRSLWLVAVLVLPVAAVHRSARIIVHQEHKVLHDTLTGLPNRLLFRERFEQALLQTKRTGVSLAVMLVDLDRFKQVNDTHGHGVGDELLRAVAPRLAGEMREIDTVARLGGDEFAVLIAGVQRPADATAVAERIVKALEQPFVVRRTEVDIGASIGIALAPQHAGDVDALLERADTAMYGAKSRRCGYLVYEDGDSRTAEPAAP